MDVCLEELREHLAARSYLHRDPASYLSGVDETIRALRRAAHPSAGAVHPPADPAPLERPTVVSLTR